MREIARRMRKGKKVVSDKETRAAVEGSIALSTDVIRGSRFQILICAKFVK